MPAPRAPTVPSMLRRSVALVFFLAACSRVPDEPTPVVRPTTEHKAPPVAPTTTVIPESPTAEKKCPMDPSPDDNSKLYGHGTASFITPDGVTHTFKVEIARSDEAQERGLMYRTSLAEDAGMVFDFKAVHHATFWMHNTCIPLDMVFVSEDKLVIGVVTAPPLNDEGRSVPGLSKYVVELAAGVAKKKGIAIGTKFVPPLS